MPAYRQSADTEAFDCLWNVGLNVNGKTHHVLTGRVWS